MTGMFNESGWLFEFENNKKSVVVSGVIRGGFDVKITVDTDSNMFGADPRGVRLYATAVRSYKHADDKNIATVLKSVGDGIPRRYDCHEIATPQKDIAELVGEGEFVFMWDSGDNKEAFSSRTITLTSRRQLPSTGYTFTASSLLYRILPEPDFMHTSLIFLSDFMDYVVFKFNKVTDKYVRTERDHYQLSSMFSSTFPSYHISNPKGMYINPGA